MTRILFATIGFILIGIFIVWVFWERLPIRLIWPYLSQQPIAIEGEVQKITFTGRNAGEQTFFVYLPQGYNEGNQRYRTLYHLHGAFMRESGVGQECNFIGSKMEEAVTVGIIEPLIIVCPVDPDGNRMWSDSFDGQYLASMALIEDLIPYIDTNYRTIAERKGRALQGFSMGGFGAVTNGFRSPELFSAIIIWDGALHDWQTLSTNRQSIASKMFATEAYFDQWSPYKAIEQDATPEPEIFMVVGTMGATRDFASRFKPHLEGTGRDFIYHDSPCPHSMFCMLDDLGTDAFTFLAMSFSE